MHTTPQHVVITGAGSGLGRAMALNYAKRGARVAICDLSDARAVETLALIGGDSAHHMTIQMNVADSSDWQRAHALIKAQFGHVSVLINNAGVASSGDFLDTDDTEWDRVVSINLTSVQRGCRALLPLMLGTRGSLVINTASFAALAAAPDTGVYGVTKAAVLAYSEILRAQLYAHGLHVACLCPSFFKTNLLESFAPGNDSLRKVAQHLMDGSAIDANDVAEFAISQAQAGVFLLLPHKDTRSRWRLKRWMPETYFKTMLKFVKRDKLGA
jgi:NAD(P)-dependent dehydrogenase (short-subunit alcohol dehydrogenase family)